jgi:methylmalonyl-CoA/ethylmalonyl-CoA epimerase
MLEQARVDHIGIAVADLGAAAALYRTMLGVEPQMHMLPEQGIAVAMFHLPHMRIELLAPIGSESPITGVLEDYTIQAFMARQPLGGLHHVCYAVPDLDAAQPPGTRRLGTGVPIIGAQGKPIVFLDPKTTGGTLIELKQAA